MGFYLGVNYLKEKCEKIFLAVKHLLQIRAYITLQIK